MPRSESCDAAVIGSGEGVGYPARHLAESAQKVAVVGLADCG